MAARYHSLVVDASTLPPELRVTAMSEVDRVVMGIRHTTLPLEGVQFHPESVLTPEGPHLLANFLRLAGEGEASLLDAASGSFATAGLAESPERSGERPGPRRARHDRRGRDALDGGCPSRDGSGDGRRSHARATRGPADGPADARRDRRRARRIRRGDAGARRRGSRHHPARSTSSGPAATGAARSTSRRPRHS